MTHPTLVLDKDTSKAYAAKAKSRLLTNEQNFVLANASSGQTVDAVEFRKAVTAALSLAATRAGQSMSRREWTKEARHLLYIADAVIDNHIDGLPAYAEGDRSRKVVQLSQENSDLTLLVDGLVQNNSDLEAQNVALREALESLRANSVQFVKVSEYARSLLDEVGRAKVEGFIEGLDA